MAEDKKIIPDIFGQMMQGDSERLQIAKELFVPANIDMKTELEDREINTFARAEFIKDVIGLKSLEIFINKFERLRVSKKREGRKEFVECVKEREQKNNTFDIGSAFRQGKL